MCTIKRLRHKINIKFNIKIKYNTIKLHEIKYEYCTTNIFKLYTQSSMAFN